MSVFDLNIPNLNVNVDTDINKTLVVLRQSATTLNRSSIPIQSVAESAITASYAITASHALNVSGFATTGSNIFYGDQDIIGQSGDVNINIDETEPHIEIMTSNGSENAEYHTYQLFQYSASFGYFGFTIDTIRAGYSGWDGPSIAGDDGVFNYPAFIGFQDARNYTDGRVTILTPLAVSGSILFPDGTTQSTAIIGTAINTSSFATTGSNTFVGDQIITGSLTISGSATLKNIGPTIFSGSLNVINGITGSINYSSITDVPEGLVSSSGQIVAALPAGIVSSSTQFPSGFISSSAQLPAGIVSSSIQVLNYNTFATTESNTFVGNQVVSGAIFFEGGSSITGNVANLELFADPSGEIILQQGLEFLKVSSQKVMATNIEATSVTGSLYGTSSWADTAVTSSYANIAQLLLGSIESASYATTASYALVATAEVPQGTISSSAQLPAGTISSSAQLPSGTVSSSAQTTANLPSGIVSSSTQVLNYNTFATTGSNTFTANQVITGSLTVTSNLIVQGSSSISFVSQSTLNIGTNLVTVNAQNPSVRFGGLAVIDSASSPQVSGSLLFDSVENQWLYVHQNQTNITSSILLMGPETYNNVGNETHPTTNRVMKSINDEHIGDSQITDDGTTVSIPGNLTVTGIVSGSQFSGRVTGSLFGTSSWAVSASHANTAAYTSLTGTPVGLVSSSTQISQFGTIRLTVGTTNKNSGASFYFNSNTVTSGDSSSPGQDTAFLIQSTGLSTVNVYLRQSAAGPNNTIVGIAKNADGTAFSSATLITSSSANLTANTIHTYTFSGLTLNQFDAIHIYVDPTSAPTDVFGVIVVS